MPAEGCVVRHCHIIPNDTVIDPLEDIECAIGDDYKNIENAEFFEKKALRIDSIMRDIKKNFKKKKTHIRSIMKKNKKIIKKKNKNKTSNKKKKKNINILN